MEYKNTINLFLKTRNWVVKLGQAMCFVFFSAMIMSITLAVLTRYVLPHPLNFCDALGKYLMIWMIFVAAGLAVSDRQHIAIDMVIKNWSMRAKKMLAIIINIPISAFLIMIIVMGTSLVFKSVDYSDPIVWNLSFAYIYLSVPVGFFFMLILTNIQTALYCLDAVDLKQT